MMPEPQILEILRYLVLAAFVLLSIVSLVQWLRRRDEAGGWLALTFLVLAGVAVSGRLLPDDPDLPGIEIIQKMQIAILLLFPYFLFRFGAAFRQPSPIVETIAGVLTLGVIVWGFFLGEFPEPGAPRPPEFQIYVIAILVQWVVLSLIVAVWLWRGGRGQPMIARRRMRLLSIAASLLSVALVISGAAGGGESVLIAEAIQILALGSAVAFFFGFSPPEWIRASWRRKPTEDLRRAIAELVTAESEEDVTRSLMPHMAGLVGSPAIAFADSDNRLLAANGISESTATDVIALMEQERTDFDRSRGVLVQRYSFGSIYVWTSPYAPFFGTEELQIIETLGTLAHLALERTRSAALKIQLAEAEIRRRQALQINDNVVQGLAVAKYAFELGEEKRGLAAIEQTLAAAKEIISDLLEELEPEQALRPGSLVRDMPASTERTQKS